MSYLLHSQPEPEPLDDTIRRHPIEIDGKRRNLTDREFADWQREKAEAAEAARARVAAKDAAAKAEREAKRKAAQEAATAAEEQAMKQSARLVLSHLPDAEFERRWPQIRDQMRAEQFTETRRRQQEAISAMMRKF